jgi:phosphatidylinositol glycan class W
MDAGVGSIVFCSAFVQGIKASENNNKRRTKKHDVYRLLALALLGVGRPVVTSMIGYQNHVGEYGVHWNFFLTLFVIRFVILVVPESWDSFWLGSALLCTHQFVLSGLGVNEYVNDEHRVVTNIASQNKEGLVSLVGYLCLHWLGEWSAKVCARIMRERNRPVRLLKQALFICILWTGHVACSRYVEATSRRSCNAAFVLWMLANNVQAVCLNAVILSLVAAAGQGANEKEKEKLESTATVTMMPVDLLMWINKSMLGLFLAANVLTGTVNMVFDTLAVSDTQARSILALYMAILMLIAKFLAR